MVEKTKKSKRYAMAVDLSRCFGCYACVLACKHEHRLPPGTHWMRISKIGPIGAFPQVELHFVPVLCMHCENAPCLAACPVEGALYRRDDGIIAVNEQKCNGCGVCVPACPYQALSLDRARNLVGKCDFCLPSLEKRPSPACVMSCPGNALLFGDTNDPTAEISKLLSRRSPSFLLSRKALCPSVYYVNAPEVVKRMTEVPAPPRRRFSARGA
ncbi:MAG: 4Fe-4S dicluster domain-containing protein [Chloroflexi bacterium]|nr:4Fe-4S dicluster domain-containing protein [Chloroflexota bacterium]